MLWDVRARPVEAQTGSATKGRCGAAPPQPRTDACWRQPRPTGRSGRLGHPVSASRLQRALVGHRDWVNACAFNAAADAPLASVSNDRTLRLWDLRARSRRLALVAHAQWINSCAFSPDDRFVVTPAADGKPDPAGASIPTNSWWEAWLVNSRPLSHKTAEGALPARWPWPAIPPASTTALLHPTARSWSPHRATPAFACGTSAAARSSARCSATPAKSPGAMCRPTPRWWPRSLPMARSRSGTRALPAAERRSMSTVRCRRASSPKTAAPSSPSVTWASIFSAWSALPASR